MIQCRDCEYYQPGPQGGPHLTCNPFHNIKEPECLLKWQLLKLEVMARSHQSTLDLYRRFAPLQEKLLRHMEREIDDAEESDGWKYSDEDNEDDQDNDRDYRP